MAWSSRGERTARPFGVARALKAPTVRRLLVTGGFVLTAWTIGSAAPASADALETLSEAAAATTTVTEAVIAPRAADHGIPAVTETAESIVGEAGSAASEAVSEPVTPSRPELGLTGLPEFDALDSAPVQDAADTDVRPDDAPDAPAPVPAPGADAEQGAKHTERPARTYAPRHLGDVDLPFAGLGSVERTAPAATSSGVEHDAPDTTAQSAPANPAQTQGNGFTGGFAGYLTHTPAAPSRDALASATRHALALVPRQPADEHFFSPD